MEALGASIDDILEAITNPEEKAEKAAFLKALFRPLLTMTELTQGKAVVMPTEEELIEMTRAIRAQGARDAIVGTLRKFYADASVVRAGVNESDDLS